MAAEEKGLLGSRYFAGKPTVPFRQIVANINLDMFLPLYSLKVIEVQGLAESSSASLLKRGGQDDGCRRADGSGARAEPLHPQRSWLVFIRKGVPALRSSSVTNSIAGGNHPPDLVRDIYHQPGDDLTQPVNLEAAATFNRVIMTLLQRVASDTARPTWNADSFFRCFAAPRARRPRTLHVLQSSCELVFTQSQVSRRFEPVSDSAQLGDELRDVGFDVRQRRAGRRQIAGLGESFAGARSHALPSANRPAAP